ADEPLGPSADELIDMVAAVAAVAGRERFAGLAFMAVPPAAVSLHVIASYVLLHALAATVEPDWPAVCRVTCPLLVSTGHRRLCFRKFMASCIAAVSPRLTQVIC